MRADIENLQPDSSYETSSECLSSLLAAFHGTLMRILCVRSLRSSDPFRRLLSCGTVILVAVVDSDLFATTRSLRLRLPSLPWTIQSLMAALSVLTRPPSVEPEVEAVVVLVVAVVAAAADILAVVAVDTILVVVVAVGTPEGGTAKIVEVIVAKVVDTVVDKAGIAAVAAIAMQVTLAAILVAKISRVVVTVGKFQVERDSPSPRRAL